MKAVLVYGCEHCKMLSYSVASVRRHEKECVHDPATKACATCIRFREADDWDDDVSPRYQKYCDVAFEPTVVRHCEKWEASK